MKVLSLFGGIECGLVALKRLGIVPEEYYSSEIDSYAIKITTANHPEVVHIGSITDVKYRLGELKWIGGEAKTQIDLMIGGSPCQDLSIAKANGKGLNWEKSGLFFEYMRLLTEIRPRYFLLENVASMKKADRDEITRIIGVEPIMINSALVSAQNRKRLYWTNIPGVKLPEDRGILLKDILEDIPFDYEEFERHRKAMDDQEWPDEDLKSNYPKKAGSSIWRPLDEKFLTDKLKLQLREKSYAITATYTWACPRDYLQKSNRQLIIWQFRRWAHLRIHADQENSPTLTSNMGTGGNNVPVILWINQKPRWKNSGGITYEWEKSPTITGSFEDNSKLLAVQDYIYLWRKLTPIECERLQTLPDNYTACVSNSRRYKAIGNGWTVESIAHIFSHLPWQKLSELPAEPTPE